MPIESARVGLRGQLLRQRDGAGLGSARGRSALGALGRRAPGPAPRTAAARSRAGSCARAPARTRRAPARGRPAAGLPAHRAPSRAPTRDSAAGVSPGAPRRDRCRRGLAEQAAADLVPDRRDPPSASARSIVTRSPHSGLSTVVASGGARAGACGRPACEVEDRPLVQLVLHRAAPAPAPAR